MVENTNNPSSIRRRVSQIPHWPSFLRKRESTASWIPAFEGVAKGPEKKGTTKTRRHKVFSVLVWATLGRQKKSSFVPSCLCGSRLFTFCDTLLREDDGQGDIQLL